MNLLSLQRCFRSNKSNETAFVIGMVLICNFIDDFGFCYEREIMLFFTGVIYTKNLFNFKCLISLFNFKLKNMSFQLMFLNQMLKLAKKRDQFRASLANTRW